MGTGSYFLGSAVVVESNREAETRRPFDGPELLESHLCEQRQVVGANPSRADTRGAPE